MKTIFLKHIALIMLFSVATCFSQEEEDQLISVFSSKENSLDVVSKFSSKPIQNVPETIQNTIYIQQIGNNNYSFADIKSPDATVNFNQSGNNNSIFLDKNASEINQFVAQDGNNNSVVDFNYNFNGTVNSTFSQSGNNHTILSIGSNTISKDLTIKQSGNSGSVIILNK